MEILNTTETSKKILEVIKNAEKKLYIISPYLKMKDKYKKAIERKNIDVTVIYGKTDLNYFEEDFIFDCPSISLLYCDDLHAKIYMNENECILSSMNLYGYSENYNFEISTYFTQENKNQFKKVKNVIKEIKSCSLLEKVSVNKYKKSTKIGYCIRTGKQIDFNPEKPFCYEAWKEWSKWQNPFYPEKFCHYSGKPSCGKTNFANPIL